MTAKLITLSAVATLGAVAYCGLKVYHAEADAQAQVDAGPLLTLCIGNPPVAHDFYPIAVDEATPGFIGVPSPRYVDCPVGVTLNKPRTKVSFPGIWNTKTERYEDFFGSPVEQ